LEYIPEAKIREEEDPASAAESSAFFESRSKQTNQKIHTIINKKNQKKSES
jgi:hypothetical protein